MHEQSLVASLLQQADAIRRQHAGSRVTEVRVEVGPLSGVEPLLLVSAFEQQRQHFIGDTEPHSAATFQFAKLSIDHVPLSARCRSCDAEFEVADFVFRCPTCQGNVDVTRGDELQLVSVTVDDENSPR
ncbi:MAG: hydrogenase maturation nickel metallochaperone HypA [Planctomycetaceae bacterium]